jgi:hypothetical protein
MAEEKIITICPAPSNMRVRVITSGSSYTEEEVVCLALMEAPGGSRRVVPLILSAQEIRIQEVYTPAAITSESGALPAEDEPVFVVVS